MSRLRLKLELNPGGDGIRLDKLASISGELEKFLRNLANDCGVKVEPGEWVARQFYNSSVGAVLEHVEHVEPVAVQKFNDGVRFFSSFAPDQTRFSDDFSEQTIRQFVDIGTKLDTDEIVKIGLFAEGDGDEPLEWKQIAKRTTIDVEEAALRPIVYQGSVQGRLGTWFKESDFIYIRDAVTDSHVKCSYKPSAYDMIYRYYADKSAIVHVTGQISADRLNGHPREIKVESIEHYGPLSDKEFKNVFGSAPDLIGDEPVEDFIDRIRGDGDS